MAYWVIVGFLLEIAKFFFEYVLRLDAKA